jgi:tetratricopeptide (TPR) repeat protein
MGGHGEPGSDAEFVADPRLHAEEQARMLAREGAGHLQRYRDLDADGATGSRLCDEVDAAVTLFRAAAQTLPPQATDSPAFSYNLAIALQSRYDVLHAAADLDEALAVLRLGISSAARGSAYLAVLQYGLGTVLRRVYDLREETAILAEAIGVFGDALANPHSENLDYADCLYEYGRAVLAQAEIVDEREVIDEAVAAFDCLLESANPREPDYAAYLDSLGSAQLLRFERFGVADDLDGAVSSVGRAVQAQRDQGAVTVAPLANLAAALRTRGSLQAGRSEDLNRAIGLMVEALSLPGAAVLSGGLQSNLSAMLLERAERAGVLDDLEEAVQLAEESVRATPREASAMPLRAHQLAIARRSRFLRLGDTDDLAAAVAAHATALNACPASDPNRRALLSSWANTLRTRYDTDGDIDDLRAAVRVYEETLAGIHRPSSDRAMFLNNLGAVLAELASVNDEAAAAVRAAEVLAEAIELGAPGSLERLRAVINLGNVLADQYAHTHDPAMRERALKAYEEVRLASASAAAGPETVFQAAVNCGEWAAECGDWKLAADWLERGLDAVDDLLVVQQLRGHKESWLRDARGVATQAAIAALRSNDATKAVMFAERGRAQLVAEAVEQTRLDVDRLDAAGEHELRLRVEAARAAARAPEGATGRSGRRGDGPVNRFLATDLRALRDEIRGVPGFAGFLGPLPFAEIVSHAGGQQVLYLVAAQDTGAALLVAGGQARGWELPELTDHGLRTVVEDYQAGYGRRRTDARGWLLGLERATRWLWDAVIEPLLPYVDAAAPVTVVAGGLLGLLPLQAAWIEDGTKPAGRLYAADILCLRFAPSIRSLRPSAGLKCAPAAVRLLSGPGMTDPAKEIESVRAVAHVTGGGLPLASVADVIAALRASGVVHLNCHGIGRIDSPLDSAVILADASLTLERVLRERLRADLVVLSACETATLGTELPDEVVGLPSGFLQAGVGACIGSLWAVPSKPTAALMSLLYRIWAQEPMTAAEALKLAQCQLRDATNDQLTQLVPAVVSPPAGLGSSGRRIWGLAQPFRPMTSWAGFVYVGV